ncbi:MAG: penicillin acylase family protein [Bryobacteraceae bacterium]
MRLRFVGKGVVWVGLTACLVGAVPVAKADSHYSAEVRRTSFGIPHIKAQDMGGIGYGLGYAFAQDNYCVLADMIVTVNGERSKYFGPQATYDRTGEKDQQNNLSSDFYHKYLNDSPNVTASWQRQSTEVQALIGGYVAGFNRYRRDAGNAGLPAACRNQPWVRDLTAFDLIRLMRRYAVTASGSNFMDGIFAAQPPSASAQNATKPHTVGASTVALASGYTPAPQGYWKQFQSRMGSNAVALGKEATESGAGLLLANPHFPWTTAFRFYQMHLTIPGRLDVMGASLYGFPTVMLGFNRNVAWSHTVDSAAHFTLFALQLDPADPTRYLVDGISKAMSYREYSVELPKSTGGTAVHRKTWFTEYGPVMTLPGVLEWNSDSAYALADANFDNDRMMQQWLALGQAGSLGEFRNSMGSILGVPWANTIAVDKSGATLYADFTPIPNVPKDKESVCIAPQYRPLRWEGFFILSGNTAACKWTAAPGVPTDGIFPAASLPALLRSDYVQNSNDTAWFTNPLQPLTGYPSIVSADGIQLGGRTRLGLTQIQQRLAGADGLPGNRFNLKSLQQVAFSNRSYNAYLLLDGLKAACAGAAGVIAPGCAVIASWDGTANLDSTGYPLFGTWWGKMNSSGVDFWEVPFDAADPVHTPRGLKLSDPQVVALARLSLIRAMAQLTAIGVDYTQKWGQIQVAVRGSERIPISGGSDSDVYNAIDSWPTGGGQMDAYYGTSVVMTVSFEGAAPKVQGFLSYSQSTDPLSPHYADQTKRFSDLDWILYPYTQSDILADPGYSTIEIAE